MERDYYHQKSNDRVVSRFAKKLELSFALSPLPTSCLPLGGALCPHKKKNFSFFWTIIELSWQLINNDKNKLMKKTNTNSDLKLINSVRF